jgi:hypothetical protein
VTLTEFLLSRIAEDECDARDATPGPWRWLTVDEQGQAMGQRNIRADGDIPVMVGLIDFPIDQRHIARHDPARVLAECEAKRAAIKAAWGDHLQIEGEWGYGKGSDQLEAENDQPDVVKYLAAVYSDHPDYDEAWRP